MNQIVHKFLLAGDKVMPEMHLRQPGFTYSACGPFTRNKREIQKFMQIEDTNYAYKNELDKACFKQIRLMANTNVLLICSVNMLLLLH